ncbi:hypothetical protein FOA52_014574 [Chlamydomonas sp. UWO 241]|nr:hypothetical protein FOA52_014574 [Chlamydomonas sp. UWO 241]
MEGDGRVQGRLRQARIQDMRMVQHLPMSRGHVTAEELLRLKSVLVAGASGCTPTAPAASAASASGGAGGAGAAGGAGSAAEAGAGSYKQEQQQEQEPAATATATEEAQRASSWQPSEQSGEVYRALLQLDCYQVSASLLVETRVGEAVRRLRSYPEPRVARLAAALVQAWRGQVTAAVQAEWRRKGKQPQQ